MSRGLGQGELLLPPRPVRRMVPAGRGAWWGVDPSTVRVAVATVSPAGVRGVSTRPFPGLESGARLAEIFAETLALAEELAALEAPGVIVVEQPSGKTPNPQLLYAAGAIVAALVSGCRNVLGGRYVELEWVASSRWKSIACGSGNITKPQKVKGQPPPAPEDYGVLRWAREAGYVGTSWDAADAWGIADYAFRTFELVQR